jgi:ATPase family associated with various cellular activities (AAA)/AAA+ lid domain
MIDPELLEGLEAAVAVSPDNVPLRLHLGSLFLEAGRPADALEQCAAVLLRVPDHRDALELAARATMAAEPPRWAGDRQQRPAPGPADVPARGPTGLPLGRPGLEAVRPREQPDLPVRGPAPSPPSDVPLPPRERLPFGERLQPGLGERLPGERLPGAERYPPGEPRSTGQRLPAAPPLGGLGRADEEPPPLPERPAPPMGREDEPEAEAKPDETDLDEAGEETAEDEDKATGQPEVAPAPDIRAQASALVAPLGLQIEEPGVTLADVGGMSSVKQWLAGAVLGLPVERTSRRRLDQAMRGGLLEYGPPGCGKTFIARAIAGELGASFMVVDLPRVLDVRVGEGQRALHEIFQAARICAPCLLFLDELDAIGDGPMGRHRPAGRGVVEQLVAELQAVGEEQEAVTVVAASENPWDVDPLLRQPGRLDRRLLVLPPDREAREVVMERALGDQPVVEGLNLAALAGRTEGFSAADLIMLCETAIEVATEGSLAGGERPVGMEDFNHALLRVRPSPPAWLALARDFVLYAGHGGVYDDLLAYLRVRA